MTIKAFYDAASNQGWIVRIIRDGDKYGLNHCLTVNKNETLVEFYDTRYEHTDFGQFVSRYYVETLLARPSGGIDLDAGIASWKIYSDCYARITAWLKTQIEDKT